MLIYNYKKEFVGIDESDLKIFGLTSLSQLKDEVDDFADLFVKTPGYIHNFKNVHWLDYIVCGEGSDAKAMIRIKDKTFTTSIDIKGIYLNDNPLQKGYIVNLQNLRQTLSSSSSEESNTYEILQKQSHIPAQKESVQSTKISIDLEEPKEVKKEQSEKLDIDLEIKEVKKEQPKPSVKKSDTIMQEEAHEDHFKDYVYDPKVASEELGLPIDLVDEFVQDFIAQANNFKDELYIHLQNSDLTNLKIQSHKLKGVAANLRIEDALDALSVINTSKDFAEIRYHLDRLYRIIKKLSNQEDVEDMVLEFKDDIQDKAETTRLDIDLDTLAKDVEMEEPYTQNTQTTSTYDISAVASDIGLDTDSFKELFVNYVEEAKEICQKMIKEATLGNYTLVANKATKLRGMSENMRIHEFDNELKRIISSTNAEAIEIDANKIVTILNQMSKEV